MSRASGNQGEERAVKYLERKNYKILHRNFQTRYGEIDIIAKDGNTIVFVEVKARRTKKYGYGAEAINSKKIGKAIVTAQIYLKNNKLEKCTYRFDAVEITGDKFLHLENITL